MHWRSSDKQHTTFLLFHLLIETLQTSDMKAVSCTSVGVGE